MRHYGLPDRWTARSLIEEHNMEPRTTAIPMWIAEKGGRQVVCEVIAWPHGIDVRVFVDGELWRTQLCRDLDEWLPLQDEWRSKLEAEGWVVRGLGQRSSEAEGVGSGAARGAAKDTEGPAE